MSILAQRKAEAQRIEVLTRDFGLNREPVVIEPVTVEPTPDNILLRQYGFKAVKAIVKARTHKPQGEVKAEVERLSGRLSEPTRGIYEKVAMVLHEQGYSPEAIRHIYRINGWSGLRQLNKRFFTDGSVRQHGKPESWLAAEKHVHDCGL